ncbi:MAG: hypothetical protein V2A34_01580 [Lentisphaerota bacterium]
MNLFIRKWIPALALSVCALFLSACEEDCHDCHGEDVAVYEPERGPVLYPYMVEVNVLDARGAAVPYADVELIVAAVPETRLRGQADRHGTAFFQIYAEFDVAVIAYASAPGYGSQAADIGTRPDTDYLNIAVFLGPVW